MARDRTLLDDHNLAPKRRRRSIAGSIEGTPTQCSRQVISVTNPATSPIPLGVVSPTVASEQPMLPGLDSPLLGEVKNDRTTMVFSFFSLTRDRVTELPIYDDGRVRIEVSGTKYGVATIWDKELLIYIASLMVEKLNKGEPVDQTYTFTVNDFCRIAHISPSGTAYERIEGALVRLQGTQVRTNIETGGKGQDQAFSWVENYEINYRRTKEGKRMQSIRVRICDWLWRAIAIDRKILTYDPTYFDLPPLEKRLYEIARAHCGGQPGFRISLDKLRKRVGSTQELKLFRADLGKILKKKKHPLPGYSFQIKYQNPPGRRPILKNAMVEFWNLKFSPMKLAMMQLPVLEDAGFDDPFPASDGL
jgi:plasmid replication initiation protein